MATPDSELVQTVIRELDSCIDSLSESIEVVDHVIVRLESVISALNMLTDTSFIRVSDLVLRAVEVLESLNHPSESKRPGRPKVHVPSATLEHLLSMNFRVPDIASMYGVSKKTIFRRLAEAGISVSSSYTDIDDEQLRGVVTEILLNHPNTGYKRMKGFLLMRGIKVTEVRVREVLRIADPQGVYQRTQLHRAIVRREYYVDFSNQMWHIDGNLKLIRWGLVIRGGIDGKSRCVTYLDIGSDNRAQSSLAAFLTGVSRYGVPQRTRSDKGKENVLIAKYMLESRGLGRASHICGRSVHNQRIERFWGDLFRMSGFYYDVFKTLEENDVLNVDDPKHIKVLQMIFIPRIQRHLDQFREGWNCHPLSTERNKSPNQLMLLHLPPPEADLPMIEANSADLHFTCEGVEDLNMFEDTITSPIPNDYELSMEEQRRITLIDPLAESECFGCDVYAQALSHLS